MIALSKDSVRATLAHHVPLYRWYPPSYQLAMLESLAEIWEGPHERLLDIGGGTGIIGQVLQDHLPAGRVTSIDVEDRFLPSLSIDTLTYDGLKLPFADASFDAATINNVLHHVPTANRRALIAEIRRVVRGPLYIKDHLSRGRLDDTRLTALDWIGNTPFKGMVRAEYLSDAEWRELASHGGYRIEQASHQIYRRGPLAMVFPNRLEIAMKWMPPSSAAG
jgi:ubiquinone/menaquinone biosynthesis C-methylase UbiE